MKENKFDTVKNGGNKNSIEEDINRCNKLTETTHANWIGISNQLAIEHILSDYKRLLKENEELQEDRNKFKKALGKRITYCNELEKDLFENGSNYVIPKQKVKDKIEELKQERDETYTKFLGGNRTDENLSTRGKMIEGGIKVLQELLEESEE